MTYVYQPSGVCSRKISIELEGSLIKSVEFTGGCHGNLQGVSRLVEGMTVEQAVGKIRGIRCGMKTTSCPDQLSKALTLAFEEEMKEQARA